MWESWPKLSLKEITNDNDGAKYFLFLNRHNKNDYYIKITLLDGSNAYHVELTYEEYQQMAEKVRMTLSEFTDLSIPALTCETGTDTFTYSVTKTDSNVQLTWKKVVPDDSVKIRLGCLNFRTINNANEVCNTLQQLSKYIGEKSCEIKVLQNEKSDLQATNKQLRNILETEIVSKEKLETDLYSKFVIVLNKKKEKCRQYKAELSKPRHRQLDSDGTSSDEVVEESVTTQSAKRESGLLFEDSSDDCQPTLTQRVVKQKRSNVAKPRKETEKRKQRTNARSKPSIYEADTQDLMDDL